jgi:hypothetical protein
MHDAWLSIDTPQQINCVLDTSKQHDSLVCMHRLMLFSCLNMLLSSIMITLPA